MTTASRHPGPLPPIGTAAIVVLTSALFALSFGFNFGVGNHTAYLLPALRILDPELFTRDWALSSSTQYHQAFAYVAALLLSLDPNGWAVGLGHTFTILGGTLAVYALCRALVGPRLALPSFILLVSVLLLTRTAGPGVTYVFDGTLQPSTLSSALLLGAISSFVAARYRLSGVLLALSGLFHINFSLLSAAAFGIAQLALGRQGLGRRLLEQLGPACIVLLAFVPTLAGAATSGAETELGRFVYLYVRAPHHFALAGKATEFLPLAGWSLVAWGVIHPLASSDVGVAFRRLTACALGLLVTVSLGTLAALVSDAARALFSWRVAPHAELVLQAGAVAGAARLATETGHSSSFGGPRLLTIGGGLALVFAGWAVNGRTGPLQVVAWIALGVTLCVLSERHPSWNAWRMRTGPRSLTALAALLLAGFALRPLGRMPRHSSLIQGLPVAEAALFGWMRAATGKSALFLIPPELDGAQLFGHRAVVVDWKNTPAVPSETVAWYRRLEDVTGRPALLDIEALAGYDEIDPARFERLRARYGFDYAVVRRGREVVFPDYEKPYQNADFVVLRSRLPGSTMPPR